MRVGVPRRCAVRGPSAATNCRGRAYHCTRRAGHTAPATTQVRRAASNSSEVLPKSCQSRRTDSAPQVPRVGRAKIRHVHCRGMAHACTAFRCGAPPQCMTALRQTGDRSRPKRRSTVGIHQVCIRAAVLEPDVLVAPPCARVASPRYLADLRRQQGAQVRSLNINRTQTAH